MTSPTLTIPDRPAAVGAPAVQLRFFGDQLCFTSRDQAGLAALGSVAPEPGAIVPIAYEDSQGQRSQHFAARAPAALRLIEWITAEPREWDRVSTAIIGLLVEALECVTAGEVVPLEFGGATGWYPGPAPRRSTTIAGLKEAALNGTEPPLPGSSGRFHEPEDVVDGFLATAVNTFAAVALPAPEHGYDRATAQRLAARLAANAALRLELDIAPGRITLRSSWQDLHRPTNIVAIDHPDAARRLQTKADRLAALLPLESDAARRGWSGLPGGGVVTVDLSPGETIEFLDVADHLLGAGIIVAIPTSLRRPSQMRSTMTINGPSAGLSAATLGLSTNVTIDGEELSEDELAAITSDTEFAFVRGEWIRLDIDQRDAALALLSAAQVEHSAAEVLELAALADEIVGTEQAGWLSKALAGTFVPSPSEKVKKPKQLKAKLRHYQEDGLAWLAWLDHNELGGILADDMGLGKTVTLLSLIAHDVETATEKLAHPTLIVVPTTIITNWLREAKRFTPKLKVAVHHGATRPDPSTYAGKVDIVLTSYGTMRSDEALQKTTWHRAILDEAQAIKNPSTATSRVARHLIATHRLCATGTPVENHLLELWALMDFANPGLLGTMGQFRARYVTVTDDERPTALAGLRRVIAPFILRRTKTQPGIADELPERIVVRDDCGLTPEQAQRYRTVTAAMLADAAATTGIKRKGAVLAGITRLKQICNHPDASKAKEDGEEIRGVLARSSKLTRATELLAEIIDEGEAVVVFSQYPTFLKKVADAWSAELGVPVGFVDGSMTRKARDAAVDAFCAPDGPPILCVSLRAGGTGLNLVRANHVIHLDRWWNPAVEDQASDRVWRIGQTRGVVVHTLVCAGTLEERIADLLEEKRALADAVLTTDGDSFLSDLDDTALAALVELDPDRIEALR